MELRKPQRMLVSKGMAWLPEVFPIWMVYLSDGYATLALQGSSSLSAAIILLDIKFVSRPLQVSLQVRTHLRALLPT
jgi:hypothetical protein